MQQSSGRRCFQKVNQKLTPQTHSKQKSTSNYNKIKATETNGTQQKATRNKSQPSDLSQLGAG